RVAQSAPRKPDLMTGIEFRCNRGEADWKIFDAAFLQTGFETRGEMAAADQAGARQADIEITEHAANGQCACPAVEVIHFLAGIAAADDSADGRADDHIGNNAVRFKRANYANMSETTSCAAAKRKADGRTHRGGRRMRRGFRRTVAIARSRE